MRVHVLQHVAFEGLGSMEAWLANRGASVTFTRFFEAAHPLPALDGLDLIIALGGPMSVNDEARLPWLQAEKRFIAEAIATGKAVLGICLGAQLMANALGAKVYPGAHKEIGWFPVHAEPTAGHGFQFPDIATVFHWHGETFDLPPGAVHLARSEGCRHQAFQVGTRAIGLQFHLETTPDSAAAIMAHCGDELVPGGPYVQSKAALKAVPESHYAGINALMAKVLDHLTDGLPA
ncbi:MAG: type 1 glutamine amidotransferase [Rubrivivax sp.]|nr:MAG: type 1 glutamine amidotransferase [Rubrivivax sp.]